jgi:hypothetical protein
MKDEIASLLSIPRSFNIQNDEVGVMQNVAVDDEFEGVYAVSPYRENLQLFSLEVNDADEKRRFLIKLLKDNLFYNQNDDAANMKAGQRKRKSNIGSTIIYVWRRDEVDSLYEYLHALNLNLESSSKNRNKRPKLSSTKVLESEEEDADSDDDGGYGSAVSIVRYHAGLSAEQRERAQNQFIRLALIKLFCFIYIYHVCIEYIYI